ncbi:MAG TPA: NUDIX domain-containing protein [Gemmatimonadales bacterium]|nr:NUDIX domain-containing protein [Gemmatimonadales bacterium]
MARISAGVLVYRKRQGVVEVLLVHPGGPFWAKRDTGAWSIPKGEADPAEPLLDAARREFHEETGFTVSGDFTALSPLRQPGGKVVHAWAVEGDCDPTRMRSNTFTLEWPPRSGKQQEFPEIDRVDWFAIDEALRRILPGQASLLRELATLV